jgi:Holliday junction resolvase RusA-like endonuclease
MQINLAFPVEPIPNQSVRASIRYDRYKKPYIHYHKPKNIVDYQKNIAWIAKSQLPCGFKLIDGPIIVEHLVYSFSPLNSFTKKMINSLQNGDVMYKDTKPDVTDNLNKPFFDALEGILFKNDSRIVHINNLKKVYNLNPGIDLRISYYDRNNNI